MLCQVHSASSPFYSPLLRSNKTSSQRESRADPFQMNVSLCWGGWSPFSGASPPPDAPVCVGFRLRTGPGMTPYDVPVFRSDKHTAHIRYYFTHWSEQVEEETRLKRSISSSSVPTVSLRGQVPRRSHSSIGQKSLKKKLR